MDGIICQVFTSYKDRPRVGCRHLARDNLQKIVSKSVEKLGDWNAETRCSAARLLANFLRYTEDQITGYINLILPPIYKIMVGDEPFVMEAVYQINVGLRFGPKIEFLCEVFLPFRTNSSQSCCS
jgi:hypothetical protein